jgi:hypothetical protein
LQRELARRWNHFEHGQGTVLISFF